MAKLTKRQKLINSKVDKSKTYTVEEAVAVLKDIASPKFVESVDVAINLGIDPRKSDQTVRGATVLPNGTGKTVRVAVFTTNTQAALDAGADRVGMDDLAAEVKAGNLDFDVVIASPEAMRVVGALGTILGPKGLMPNPKVGTVTPNVAEAVKNAKSGQVRFRNDKAGIVHASIGKLSFDAEAIKGNLTALLNALRRVKPANSKGVYIQKVSLSTTQGAGLVLDVAGLE